MKRRRGTLLLALLPGLAAPFAQADFPMAVKDYQAGHYEAAKPQFLTLAELGDVGSQFNLGAMALQGQAGPKDMASAVGEPAGARVAPRVDAAGPSRQYLSAGLLRPPSAASSARPGARRVA